MMTIEKDPDAVLDYRWDWSAWLDGDTITGHELIADGLTVASSTTDGASVTAWISGGTLRATHEVTCRITTAAGRTDDRTMRLMITER